MDELLVFIFALLSWKNNYWPMKIIKEWHLYAASVVRAKESRADGFAIVVNLSPKGVLACSSADFPCKRGINSLETSVSSSRMIARPQELL